MSDKSNLLLPTSIIFDNAQLIDCVRQSYIDLNETIDDEIIIMLFNDAIKYLEKEDISYNEANEIIALIQKCLSSLSRDPIPFLTDIFNKYTTNSYFMISFISIFSYLNKSNKNIDLTTYHPIINDLINEVKPQIQNLNNNLIIKGIQIPIQFRVDLIINLILLAESSEQLFIDFSSFYLSKQFDLSFIKPILDKIKFGGYSQLLKKLLGHVNLNKNQIEVYEYTNDQENLIPSFEHPFFDTFLKHQSPENDELLKKKLFKIMLNEKVNLLGYLQMIFENLDSTIVKPEDLLCYFGEEYEMSPEDFIKILDNVYVLHPVEKIFVPQPKYKPLKLIESEFNNKVITNLFDIVDKDPGNFQAFYCLECIAQFLPFIFESNPQKVFNSVLPALDNFKLFYQLKVDDEIIESQKVRKEKATISALSFLFFTLNSTKIIDTFIPWFFENIKSFTLPQINCILFIFITMIPFPISNYLTAYFIKYKLYDAILDIFKMEIPDNNFGRNFKSYFLKFIRIFHQHITNMKLQDIMLIDINISKDNIFYNGSGGHIAHSIIQYSDFRQLLINGIDKKQMDRNTLNFFINNSHIELTWLKNNRKQKNVSKIEIDNFINNYYCYIKQKYEPAEKYIIHGIPDNITVKQYCSIIDNEPWFKDYVLYLDQKFPLLSEHRKIIFDIMENIYNSDKSTDENEMLMKNYNFKEYFKSYHENFLYNCIHQFSQNKYIQLFSLWQYLKEIESNIYDFSKILPEIIHQLMIIDETYIKNKETKEIIHLYLVIIKYLVKKCFVNKSESDFFTLIGNDLINFILKPQYRTNVLYLNQIYEILSFFNHCPNRTLHIISFLLQTNIKYLNKAASKLCLGIEDKQLKNMTFLSDIFLNEINSSKPNLTILSYLMRSSKSIWLPHKSLLLNLFKKLLSAFKNDEHDVFNDKDNTKIKDKYDEDDDIKINNVKAEEFIVQLLDQLAPERDSNSSISLSDSSSIEFEKDNQNQFLPIPNYLFNTAPEFWKLINEYRGLINFIIAKSFVVTSEVNLRVISSLFIDNFLSHFVYNYPECFNLDFKSVVFQYMRHKLINDKDFIKLNINQDNLYEDSYNQLNKKSPEELKNKIIINYIGNAGIDAGGLTKDWFTKIIQEIFNPKSELFEVSEKTFNYSPSRSNVAKSEEGLKRIKFAGIIVARALLQGYLIPAHLTKPFLKQILHHENKIKIKDLQDVDEILYNSLIFYNEYDFDKNPDLDLRFEVDFDGQTIELKENGSQIIVNNSNKYEFIELWSFNRMINSIEKQVKAFCDGFDSIIPHEIIKIFTPTELCLLICGVPKIDVDDLRSNVEYLNPYNSSSPAIVLFFRTIKKWDDENLAKLLMFITGTARMPSNGFAYFKNINNPIKIAYCANKNMLPMAHTCTNTLELPEYENEDEMNSKLLIAISVNDFQMI